MRRGFRIGSVRGIEVIADLSLLIIAGLLTWSLYVDLDAAFPSTSSNALLIAALVGGGLFFGSVFLHELSHSLVALRRGLRVRRIRLFIFGGVSEIEEEAETPGDELAVTLAGPAASMGLGVLFIAIGWPLASTLELPARIALIIGVANVSIALFNLLPGLPLDGGRMLRALLWRRSGDRSRGTRIAVRTGRAMGVLLGLTGIALVAVLGNFTAIWFIAVGWFLYEAASTSAVQEQFMSRIEGLSVADVMRRTELAVDGDMSVGAALEMHGWGDKLRSLPVAVDGRVLGVLGTREVRRVDDTSRQGTLVRDAMTPIGPGDVVAADTPLREALAMREGAAGVLVVVAEGEVAGVLTAEELATVFGDLRRRR
ncbi:MAG: site-2 protease family protein [Acidimicrobiia bacterium]|nr:site-2 protease family protein [Acidimicrobiia bacterium]